MIFVRLSTPPFVLSEVEGRQAQRSCSAPFDYALRAPLRTNEIWLEAAE
jgi:hypothetical protein